MSMALMIIDMQKTDAAWKGLNASGWERLSKTLFDLKNELEKFDVPTIHVSHQQFLPDFCPVIGSFAAVNQLLEQKHGVNLHQGPYRFFPAVNEDAIVATKETYAADTDPVRAFLNAHKVDTVAIGGVWERKPSQEQACVTATALNFAKSHRTIIVDGGTNISGGNRPWLNELNRLGVEILTDRDIVKLAQEKDIRDQSPGGVSDHYRRKHREEHNVRVEMPKGR